MNPFIAFSLYVAARVFVQYLKSRKDDAPVRSSLQFLLAALQALKAKNPVSESLLVQLDVDLEGCGLRVPACCSGKSYMPLGACDLRLRGFDIHTTPEPEQFTAGPDRPFASKATAGSSMDSSGMPRTQQQPYTGSFPDRSKQPPRAPVAGAISGGASPLYEDTSYVMDMDISFKNTSGEGFPSQPNSGHPTPSTNSNNASSQISFSSAQPEDHPNLKSTSSLARNSPDTVRTASVLSNHQEFPFFDPNLPNIAKVPGPEGVENQFALPAAWIHGSCRPSSETKVGEFDLTGMTSGDGPPWQSIGIVEAEWTFPAWSG